MVEGQARVERIVRLAFQADHAGIKPGAGITAIMAWNPGALVQFFPGIILMVMFRLGWLCMYVPVPGFVNIKTSTTETRPRAMREFVVRAPMGLAIAIEIQVRYRSAIPAPITTWMFIWGRPGDRPQAPFGLRLRRVPPCMRSGPGGGCRKPRHRRRPGWFHRSGDRP